jgi:hypothetical protein
MADDYDFDYDIDCSRCGHSPTHSRRCTELGCEDGVIDLYEYDDPINFSPGEMGRCETCQGTGIERWCPKCGLDLQDAEIRKAREQEEPGTDELAESELSNDEMNDLEEE